MGGSCSDCRVTNAIKDFLLTPAEAEALANENLSRLKEKMRKLQVRESALMDDLKKMWMERRKNPVRNEGRDMLIRDKRMERQRILDDIKFTSGLKKLSDDKMQAVRTAKMKKSSNRIMRQENETMDRIGLGLSDMEKDNAELIEHRDRADDMLEIHAAGESALNLSSASVDDMTGMSMLLSDDEIAAMDTLFDAPQPTTTIKQQQPVATDDVQFVDSTVRTSTLPTALPLPTVLDHSSSSASIAAAHELLTL